ncbi:MULTISPECIES: response regulator [unclassified Variovorax]|uniref:response regulator n=1 Tax=unclassified Variovorax TaxID=663243 RepID=UPI003F48F046
MTRIFELLILDDEPEVAGMMSELLAMYFPEASIRVAFSGEEAVKLAKEKRPSVAIFDLEMAGLGGAGAARELRLTWPEVPPLLIALSGNVSKLDALGQEGPFNHLLSKPVDMATLVKLLNGQV